MKIIIIGFISVATVLSSCSTGIVEVSKDQYGDKWPFTVEKGTVSCSNGVVALFHSNGKTYKLNGVFSSVRFEVIDPIWRRNPDTPGSKIDISQMINLALEQC